MRLKNEMRMKKTLNIHAMVFKAVSEEGGIDLWSFCILVIGNITKFHQAVRSSEVSHIGIALYLVHICH